MKIRPLYDRVVIKRVEEKGDALRGRVVDVFRRDDLLRPALERVGHVVSSGFWRVGVDGSERVRPPACGTPIARW